MDSQAVVEKTKSDYEAVIKSLKEQGREKDLATAKKKLQNYKTNIENIKYSSKTTTTSGGEKPKTKTTTQPPTRVKPDEPEPIPEKKVSPELSKGEIGRIIVGRDTPPDVALKETTTFQDDSYNVKNLQSAKLQGDRERAIEEARRTAEEIRKARSEIEQRLNYVKNQGENIVEAGNVKGGVKGEKYIQVGEDQFIPLSEYKQYQEMIKKSKEDIQKLKDYEEEVKDIYKKAIDELWNPPTVSKEAESVFSKMSPTQELLSRFRVATFSPRAPEYWASTIGTKTGLWNVKTPPDKILKEFITKELQFSKSLDERFGREEKRKDVELFRRGVEQSFQSPVVQIPALYGGGSLFKTGMASLYNIAPSLAKAGGASLGVLGGVSIAGEGGKIYTDIKSGDVSKGIGRLISLGAGVGAFYLGTKNPIYNPQPKGELFGIAREGANYDVRTLDIKKKSDLTQAIKTLRAMGKNPEVVIGKNKISVRWVEKPWFEQVPKKEVLTALSKGEVITDTSSFKTIRYGGYDYIIYKGTSGLKTQPLGDKYGLLDVARIQETSLGKLDLGSVNSVNVVVQRDLKVPVTLSDSSDTFTITKMIPSGKSSGSKTTVSSGDKILGLFKQKEDVSMTQRDVSMIQKEINNEWLRNTLENLENIIDMSTKFGKGDTSIRMKAPTGTVEAFDFTPLELVSQPDFVGITPMVLPSEITEPLKLETSIRMKAPTGTVEAFDFTPLELVSQPDFVGITPMVLPSEITEPLKLKFTPRVINQITPPIIGSDLKITGGTELDTRVINKVGEDMKTGEKIKPDLKISPAQEFRTKAMFSPTFLQNQPSKQNQEFNIRQKESFRQMQISKPMVEVETARPKTSKPKISIPSFPSFNFGLGLSFGSKGKKSKIEIKPTKTKAKPRADLLSITKTEWEFPKATQPTTKLLKKYKKKKRTLRVPTKEIIKGKVSGKLPKFFEKKKKVKFF